jgi:hypothetical protein
MTAKQIVIQLADNLGIEIELEFTQWPEQRRLHTIWAYTPEGFRWDDALHGRVCALQDDLSEDFSTAEELWTWAIEELETPLEKCPPDCLCL